MIVFADAAGDGVEADGDFTFEVAADCVQPQAQPLASFLVLGTIVVMPGSLRVGSVRVEGLSTPVHKEVEAFAVFHGQAVFFPSMDTPSVFCL